MAGSISALLAGRIRQQSCEVFKMEVEIIILPFDEKNVKNAVEKLSDLLDEYEEKFGQAV